MIGSLEHPPIVMKTPRGKSLAFLVIFIVLAGPVIGVTVAGPNEPIWHLLAGAALFGIGVLLFGWPLVRPETLTISADGLRYTTLWRTHSLAWADVLQFGLTTMNLSTWVTVNYAPSYGRNPGLRKFNQSWMGLEGMLPNNWEMDPASLCKLLNDARERWAGASR